LKKILIMVAIFFIVAVSGDAYDFSTETITRIVGEETGVWPAFNITLGDLADIGVRIAITDPDAIMAIYRLSDIGKATGATVYIEEWNRSPPILFMDRNGSLGHSLVNTSQVHTQTRVIIYDEKSGEIQQRVIDPWGTAERIAQRVKYPV